MGHLPPFHLLALYNGCANYGEMRVGGNARLGGVVLSPPLALHSPRLTYFNLTNIKMHFRGWERVEEISLGSSLCLRPGPRRGNITGASRGEDTLIRLREASKRVQLTEWVQVNGTLKTVLEVRERL